MYPSMSAEPGMGSMFTGVHSVPIPSLVLVRGCEKKLPRRQGALQELGKDSQAEDFGQAVHTRIAKSRHSKGS